MSKQHSTYNRVAEQVIVASKTLPAVKKIALGPIKSVSGGEARITLREDLGQVRVQCRDIGSVQVLWVIGVSPQELQTHLESQLRIKIVL